MHGVGLDLSFHISSIDPLVHIPMKFMGEPTLLTNMLQTWWQEGCWILGCDPRFNHLVSHKFNPTWYYYLASYKTAHKEISRKSIIGTKIFLKALKSKLFTYLTPQCMDAVTREEEEEMYVNMATLECSLTHRVYNQFFC